MRHYLVQVSFLAILAVPTARATFSLPRSAQTSVSQRPRLGALPMRPNMNSRTMNGRLSPTTTIPTTRLATH